MMELESRRERWKRKAEDFKAQKELELGVQKAKMGLPTGGKKREINSINSDNSEVIKKAQNTYSTPQLHQIYQFNVRWGVALTIVGTALMIVALAFMGVVSTPLGRDMSGGLIGWIVGMALLGIGVAELLHSRGTWEVIQRREVGSEGELGGGKTAPLDPKK